MPDERPSDERPSDERRPDERRPDERRPDGAVRTPPERRRRRAVRPGPGGDEPSGTPVDEEPGVRDEVAEEGDRWLREQRPPHHGG